MSEKKLVKLEFVNKQNELKKVEFYMDMQTYEMLDDESISNEEKQKYLIEEYHMYEREKYHNRKIVRIDEKNIDFFNELIDDNKTHEQKYMSDKDSEEFFSFFKVLNDRQKELIKFIYFYNKIQEEVAKIFGVSKAAINQSLNRIYKKIKKILKNH